MGRVQYDLTVTLNFTVEVDEENEHEFPQDVPYLGPRTSEKRLLERLARQAAVLEWLEDSGVEGIEWDDLAQVLGADRAWCCSVDGSAAQAIESWGRIEGGA